MRFAIAAVMAIATVYGSFWWGVWCGERGIVRAWVPGFRPKPMPLKDPQFLHEMAGRLAAAARKHEEQLVRSIFEDGSAGAEETRKL